MKRSWMLVGLLLSLPPAAAFGQTGFSITGGLSNFDCGNHCDEPCDEFEIEIEGIHPEDVVHTYSNSNYHSPTVTLSAAGTSTIIDYRNPTHLTAVNAIEHFGISLRQLSVFTPIHVRWMKGGHTATVNGQIPNTSGGGTVPATQPILPSITADMGVASTGGDGVSCTVTNNDPTQAIWIKRRAQVTVGAVTLEALMPDNPVVTTSIPIDAAPVFLGAGESVTITSDLEIEVEDNQSAVFAAEYYQDIFGGGIFGQTHVPGPALGNVMTATITSPGTGCDQSAPVIILQPQNVTADAGRAVQLQVNADGNDLTLSYQWMKEGAPIANGGAFHGVTTDELEIDPLSTATEGFYSLRVSNTCGSIVSQSALVFITGHNTAPPRPPVCIADFDGQNGVTIDDIFMFLNAWFADSTAADMDGNGVNIDDIFLFLNAWFAGC